MISKRLEMIFENLAGSRVTISVQDPRDDLGEEEVRGAMEAIITKNVFTSPGGDLVGIIGARIVTTEVAELLS